MTDTTSTASTTAVGHKVRGATVWLPLQRPERMNAIDPDLIVGLMSGPRPGPQRRGPRSCKSPVWAESFAPVRISRTTCACSVTRPVSSGCSMMRRI